LKVVNNAISAFDEQKFRTTPLVARGYINSAHGERLLGDFFCEVAYGFDHTGGIALDNLGDSEFDNAAVPKDSAFKRMATFGRLALEQAERAVAAGAPNPANTGLLSDGHFEPSRLVTSAHAVLAQAHHALASLGVDPGTNWPLAVQHASLLPTYYVEVTIHDSAVEDNEFGDITWDNDDVTLYSEAGGGLPQGFIGVPATFQWPDDPRVQFQDCTVNDSGCRSTESEGEDWPMWVPLKYPEEGSDDEMVTGTEMRLIEAEEALVNQGNLGLFYDKVDEARAFHGAPPTERPMVIGQMEFPNAEDDAMSILDRERYLDLWMEGRRLFDLHRWNHPFITQNAALIPRHAELLLSTTRRSCAPIAETECTLNPNLSC
ncbi:MAG: RagB/SusD family nutrient uptake outer membrane protein, partial [Gemmatimonadota bacterium]|nr:RagB/SusD family nutrient uptake outer membrane protein [Gemmatimonadota bacterium]